MTENTVLIESVETRTVRGIQEHDLHQHAGLAELMTWRHEQYMVPNVP